MSAQSADMSELKSLLRGLLISTRKAMTAEDLQRDFRNQEGHDIPYRKFGKATLLDFLRSIPDTVKVESSFGSSRPIITPVLSEKSSHVEALVQKQKVNPPRRGYNRNSALRRNAIHPIVKPRLIPYQFQQRLCMMLYQHPEGIPLSKLEQIIGPSILHGYGLNCSVGELIENLGHIVKVTNGRVYSAETRVYIPNRRNTFVPPRLDNRVRQIDDNASGDWGQQTVTHVNSYQMKPAGYEDEPVHNGDSNIDEEESEDDDNTSNTVTTPPKESSSRNNKSADEDIPTYSSTPSDCGNILINNAMRNKFIALLDKNPDGIRCSELPQLYKENFKVDLDYRGLGFFSVLQMVSNLPNVFHFIRQDGEDWKVLDARKPLPQMYKSCDMKTTARVYKNTQPHVPTKIKNNIERLLMLNSSGLWTDFFMDKYQEMFGHNINFEQLNFDSLESFLLFLNDEVLHMRYVMGRIMLYPHVEQKTDTPLPHVTEPMDLFVEFYPAEVVGPKDTIPQQKLPPDTGPGSFLEVLVAEVYTPQHFWLQLRGEKTHIALDKLMNDIQNFYDQEIDYKMPEATVRIDQYCMAPFNDELHRARITALPSLTEAQVCFVDYGTKSKVKKTDLRFMHQDFAEFPIQAIKASLANIKPSNSATRWPRIVSQRFLQLVSDKNLVAIVSTANHEYRELEVALVDTTGEEDIHINDTLKHEGLADYKTSEPVPAPAPATPQHRIEVENVAPSSRRPPPGFTTVPPASPAPSAAPTNLQSQEQNIPGPSCFMPPASNLPQYINPAFLNQMIAPTVNMQLQNAYLSSLILPALMYSNSFAALANPLGMPMINPSMLFTPPPMMNKNVNAEPEINTSKVQPSPPQAAGATASSQSPPRAQPTKKCDATESVHLQMSKMDVVDVPCTSETESEKTIEVMRKISDSVCSTDSSGLEQYEVVSLNAPVIQSENQDNEPTSDDSEELYRSDDDDDEDDVIVESVTEQNEMKIEHSPVSLRPLCVKKVEIARKLIHIINIQSTACLCTEEVVRLFTEFSGRHVILKILDAKGVVIPFREISRRESPEIIEILEKHNVVGLPKSFIAGTIMGKVHLTPLLAMPQLLTVLNVRNREVFRGVQEEIHRFNCDDFYWTRITKH